MKLVKFPLFLCLLLVQSTVLASNALWTPLSIAQRSIDVDRELERQFRLDKQALQRQLSRAGFEGRSATDSTLELPLADGRIQRFRVEQSPIMAPELAAKFPDFKSYRVQGVDDPALSGRLSLSKKGFHGMISGPQGTLYIDPQGGERYRVYDRNSGNAVKSFQCGVKSHTLDAPVTTSARRAALRTPGNLRVYRLAVAATAEYTASAGGTVQDAMDEIGIAINRVNQIYNRDLGIKLVLVGNNDQLIYTNAATDPYTNNDGNTMLEENQQTIDQVIGAANYDIGHVFSTGGGGIAEVGSVCTNSVKAGGVTGSSNPKGEHFYIDYVAHEIGHQFSGEHTFNGTEESCGGGNRWAASAFEPGSGSTIMSYAGICGQENISRNTVAVFHAGSIDLVDDFTTNGAGASCGGALTITNPSEPVVDAGADYTIPAQTPFMLKAVGSDNDGDALNYSWDEMDAGTATDKDSFGQDLGDNSLFRSYLPRSLGERHFPALGTTLQNLYDQSEVMACSSRDLKFRVTVLDGNSGIGRDDVKLTVTRDAGPFRLTSHSSSQRLSPGDETVTWEVANTDQPPVNCAEVDISLLTFNAQRTFYSETLLAAGLPNNGSASVQIPDKSSSFARFKIQCSDNVFYDLSDADLSISGSQPFANTDKPVNYNKDGELYTLSGVAPVCDVDNVSSGGANTNTGGSGTVGSTPKSSSSSGGLSITALLSLFSLMLLSLLQKRRSRYAQR